MAGFAPSATTNRLPTVGSEPDDAIVPTVPVRADASRAKAVSPTTLSVRAVSNRLSAWGVTGITEATPGQNRQDVESRAAACQSGDLRQRLHCMANPDIDDVPGATIGPGQCGASGRIGGQNEGAAAGGRSPGHSRTGRRERSSASSAGFP
jgi:hypothetical protein